MSAENAFIPNPYVGPRAIKSGEKIYGRDKELLNLFDFFISERILLFYAQSGAGKTSLIQAALKPKLEQEKFYVFPIVKVGFQPPEEFDRGIIKNKYIFSLLLSLEESQTKEKRYSLSKLACLNLPDYLTERQNQLETFSSKALVFDQFEEIFTSHPNDFEQKKEFFKQLGWVLRDPRYWAMFAMREEYIANLDPYLHYIPTRLCNRFRLDLMDKKSACLAIQKPAESHGVKFNDEAAGQLADDLLRVWVEQLDGSKKKEMGLFVEPVQLQVCCRQLWDRLPHDVKVIDQEHVTCFGNVDNALYDYYGEKVAAVAARTGTPERLIRNWFENQLISKDGIRKDVLRRENQSQGLDNEVIEQLVDDHIIRAEKRRGFIWYELSHDRLIEPVLKSNRSWRKENLHPFQRKAGIWYRKARDPSLLLHKKELEEAEIWAETHSNELMRKEKEYLDECRKAQLEKNKKKRLKKWVNLLSTIVLLLAPLSLYMFYQNYSQIFPWAYLRNLSTGKVYKLKKEIITIGKKETDFRKVIDLTAPNVSDLQLLIWNNRTALFMNGQHSSTTVNGKITYKYQSKILENDDIIALSGSIAFRFEIPTSPVISYFFESIKSSRSMFGWGILIDGNTGVFPLTAKSYLKFDEDNHYIISDDPKDALLIIDRNNNTIRVQDVKDDHSLIVVKKAGKTDQKKEIFPGKQYDQFTAEWMSRKIKRKRKYKVSEVTFYYKGYEENPFQIIQNSPDSKS